MKTTKYLSVLILFLAHILYCKGQEIGPPPNGEPGKYYVKCMIPQQYETITTKYISASSKVDWMIVPPMYDTLDYVIATQLIEYVEDVPEPAYEWRKEKIMIRDTIFQTELIPAVFDIVKDSILERAALTRWRNVKIDSLCQAYDPDNCVVWYLEEIPARYRVYSKDILKKAADMKVSHTLPVYQTVHQKVFFLAKGDTSSILQNKYDTLRQIKLIHGPKLKEMALPAQYGTITVQKAVRTGGFTDWVALGDGKKGGGGALKSPYKHQLKYREQGAETYQGIKENKFVSLEDEPYSTFSIDVDRASYSNIRSYLQQDCMSSAEFVLKDQKAKQEAKVKVAERKEKMKDDFCDKYTDYDAVYEQYYRSALNNA